MRVIVSAYACEPNRGSEPEVGWQWVTHLAKHCKVTVVTRSNNREAIEVGLAELPKPHPRFVYIDLSVGMRWVKKKMKPSFLGVSWYYSRWQKKAAAEISLLCKEHDFSLIHHITFASFRLPYGVCSHNLPSIIGPVGGCEDFPESLFPSGVFKIKAKEIFRNWMTRLHTKHGLGMRRFKSATQVIASTTEMAEVFDRCEIDSIVMPQIGMPCDGEIGNLAAPKNDKRKKLKLLFVGGILYWKGVELAVQVLKKLPKEVTLTFIGSGPDEKYLRIAVKQLGLEDRVVFLGRRPRGEVLRLYKEYDLFFYPSLHDSGSFTVIEAMSEGLPVICLNRGGPALSVTKNCGRVVNVGGREETCTHLAEAVQYYLQNPEMKSKHGLEARKRIADVYDWKQKTVSMLNLYQKIRSR